MRFCNRCGCKVDVETEVIQYPYYCPNHDENLFGVETYETNDLLDIIYGCYVREWVLNNADVYDYDGLLSFDDFMKYNFTVESHVEYLLSMYGQWHRIADYRKIIRGE